ncbi:MAG: 50S ribosomal protein L18 [bacterium]
MKIVDRKESRARRHSRIRKHIAGTAERARLCVMVSNKHIYVQLVDDEKGVTLASVSSSGKDGVGKKNAEGAKLLGKRMAEIAMELGVKNVVFDRGGYKYHGRVKAIADAVREAGFNF